jgi:hypothetical protein
LFLYIVPDIFGPTKPKGPSSMILIKVMSEGFVDHLYMSPINKTS